MVENKIDPYFPLIDLHRHLDGNVRLETILDIGIKNNLSLPAMDIEKLRPYVQVTEPRPGVMAFIDKFHWMILALVDYDACWRVTYENVLDAHDEGLDYVELRFSPFFMAQGHGLNPDGVVEAVCDAALTGQRDTGVMVNLIGIISRTYGAEVGWIELNALLTKKNQLIALDLAGDEAHYPGYLFTKHFRKARDVGWRITVHAGEIDGPSSIWQALRELGADRIGHGVAALDDIALMDYLAENGIAIECNLTSNVQTSTVSDYRSHPMKTFLENGMLVTLNTDDPGISGINLAYEYNIAAPAAGLSDDQIIQVQHNALQAAFLTDAEKSALVIKKQSRANH